MSSFMTLCIIASAFTGFVNFVFLLSIDDELRKIKREISRIKKEKGGE